MQVSQFNISFSSSVFFCKQQWKFTIEPLTQALLSFIRVQPAAACQPIRHANLFVGHVCHVVVFLLADTVILKIGPWQWRTAETLSEDRKLRMCSYLWADNPLDVHLHASQFVRSCCLCCISLLLTGKAHITQASGEACGALCFHLQEIHKLLRDSASNHMDKTQTGQIEGEELLQ